MKRLTAHIKPMTVDTVEDYFRRLGYPVLKMCIKDNCQTTNRSIFWRGEEYIVDLIRNVKMEVLLEEKHVDEAVQNISNFLYEKDENNCEYEYALRLKLTTEKGRWVSMEPRHRPEKNSMVKESETLEVVDAYI